MSRFNRYEIIEQRSIFHHPCFPIPEPDLIFPTFPHFEQFETISDLIQIHRVTHKPKPKPDYIQQLNDRLSALELGFDRMVKQEENKKKKKKVVNRKYTWTAEIKSDEKERKYTWVGKVKGEDESKSYKWMAEIKGKDEQSYIVKVSSGKKEESKKKKKSVKESKGKGKNEARIVEIEESSNNGGIVLRQVFAKRVEKSKGKRKQLAPQDAAALIQMTFRAYLIRRSQALRALRELAIAKTKLKELRSLFNNFSYRRRISSDAEERQRFTEKIIVLLLTVDAIEGADVMVRSAKKSMVDELEAMLDVVDPQPTGKSLSMRRRTFDMPDGVINKEMAAGVAQVVRLLNDEEASETFEE